MSAWLVTNNTVRDSTVGVLIGGGRDNLVVDNTFVRCGTMVYLNAQGTTFDSAVDNCSDVSAPLTTQCNTGAAEWMLTKAPAAAEWASRWPELITIRQDHLGYPYGTKITGNTYCGAEFFISGLDDMDAAKARMVFVEVSGNAKTTCPPSK